MRPPGNELESGPTIQRVVGPDFVSIMLIVTLVPADVKNVVLSATGGEVHPVGAVGVPAVLFSRLITSPVAVIIAYFASILI